MPVTDTTFDVTTVIEDLHVALPALMSAETKLIKMGHFKKKDLARVRRRVSMIARHLQEQQKTYGARGRRSR